MFEEVNKALNSLFGICFLTLLIPFVIVVVIVLAPFVFVLNQFQKFSDKKKLKKRIDEHDGVIFFLYNDYNNYDFVNYFKANHNNIKCVKVKKYENDLLVKYLVNGCLAHCYPKLVKIQNERLIEKRHYNSFKDLYKRKDDINSFFALIEQSIGNLKGE